MPNTHNYLTLPDVAAGLALTVPNASWGFSAWKYFTYKTFESIYICGVNIEENNIPTVDTTREYLLEIGTGTIGNERTIIQLPINTRADTNVGFYMPFKMCSYFPEPIEVREGLAIGCRIAGTVANVIYHGIKILYQATKPNYGPVNLPNNYQGIKSSSAGIISVGERIR